jgi:hypothetical protein
MDQWDQGEHVAGTAALVELLQLVCAVVLSLYESVLTRDVGSSSGLACSTRAA